MAVGDVSAIVDLASPTAVAEPETPETPVETEVPETTPETELETTETTPETPEIEKPIDARTNPQAIRNALKSLRDSSPEHAPVARELNNIVGRYGAYKAEFPTVASAREAKAQLEAVGGLEGLASLQSTIKSVNETDAGLYAGDPRVLDSLIEDMKSAGKLESFGKLAGPYLDKLKGLDEKAYYETMKPHFYQGLVEVGLPNALKALAKVLSGEKPDLNTAKSILEEVTDWFGNLENTVKGADKDKLAPERQAFERERTEYQTQKQRDFESSVSTSCDSASNRELGTTLKGYLKSPFFKGFSRESLQDLAGGIKQRLLSELTADKNYQAQMDAFFSVQNPDKAKIEQYHASKVKTMANRIVKSVIETRYPNYLKVGAKAKLTVAKPGTVTPTPTAGRRPEYVSAKPPSESIDWKKTTDLEFIAGRAYLTNGKYVGWHPKYKSA